MLVAAGRGIQVAYTAENLEQNIREVGEPLARALGVEILEVQCSGKPSNLLVRLTLDKKGGVGIEDCEQFHQSLRRTWEVLYPDRSTYRFEVSSPGLDRPLKERKDFERVIDEQLRITLKSPLNKQSVVVGRLVAVTDEGLQLMDEHTSPPQDMQVMWPNIAKARIEIQF